VESVRRACIDIGSNTTRLLVAECRGDGLHELHHERAFTRLGGCLLADGTIPPGKIAAIVDVVAGQYRAALALGAAEVRAVGTAAIRRSPNGTELADAILRACGLTVEILSGEEEARLAFVGAARTLDHVPGGELGVVDVGGGSCELVVGTVPDTIKWSASFPLGSGDLADRFLHSDPPSEQELARARVHVAAAVGNARVPHPDEAVAVGGAAASLCRLAGPVLDGDAFARSLGMLASERAAEIARRFALEIERVPLLAAGLVILQAASDLFGAALQVGRGGLREALLLEGGP
jgi:exopolyphosphatase / guanosine-5'-triphosphate,3'-diphosphate pyrophosphatase